MGAERRRLLAANHGGRPFAAGGLDLSWSPRPELRTPAE